LPLRLDADHSTKERAVGRELRERELLERDHLRVGAEPATDRPPQAGDHTRSEDRAPPIERHHPPRLQNARLAVELEAAVLKGRPGGAGEDEIGDLGVVGGAAWARGEVGLRRAAHPAGAQIGATDDNGPRGCLIGRVEPDLLLAVTGVDCGDCRPRGSDNREHERNASSYWRPPFLPTTVVMPEKRSDRQSRSCPFVQADLDRSLPNAPKPRKRKSSRAYTHARAT